MDFRRSYLQEEDEWGRSRELQEEGVTCDGERRCKTLEEEGRRRRRLHGPDTSNYVADDDQKKREEEEGGYTVGQDQATTLLSTMARRKGKEGGYTVRKKRRKEVTRLGTGPAGCQAMTRRKGRRRRLHGQN